MRQVIILSLLIMALLNIWQFTATPPADRLGLALANPSAASLKPVHKLGAAAVKTPVTPHTANTASQTLTNVQIALRRAGLSDRFAELYLKAAQRNGIPWQLIAAVHVTETGQSGDTTRSSSAGASGPMQFMPATFRAYALDGDGDGHSIISDVDDAMFTAGNYLAVGGASHGNYSAALYRYNHSYSYVNHVLLIVHKLGF